MGFVVGLFGGSPSGLSALRRRKLAYEGSSIFLKALYSINATTYLRTNVEMCLDIHTSLIVRRIR